MGRLINFDMKESTLSPLFLFSFFGSGLRPLKLRYLPQGITFAFLSSAFFVRSSAEVEKDNEYWNGKHGSGLSRIRTKFATHETCHVIMCHTLIITSSTNIHAWCHQLFHQWLHDYGITRQNAIACMYIAQVTGQTEPN